MADVIPGDTISKQEDVRSEGAHQIDSMLEPGMKVALTTHVNADGDGTGSQVGFCHLLRKRGIRPVITNPTVFPGNYRFLLEGYEHLDKSSEAQKYLERADAVVVMDISDLGRLGSLGKLLESPKVPVGCIDHHRSNGHLPEGPRLVDPEASATGELVYDMARELGWEIPVKAARALYVALLTDTGGFRFSNTTAKALRTASELVALGVDPEEIYTRVYASVPEGKVRLLSEVLETLVVERDRGLAWVTVPPGALKRHGLDPDELEGIVEYPRSIAGVSLALLFRELANGKIKVSFRSVGDTDVSELAAVFGGGGHRRAAGASLDGTLASVQEKVLAAAREMLDRA